MLIQCGGLSTLAWSGKAFCQPILAASGGVLGVKVGVSMLAPGELRQLEATAGWITFRGPTLCPRLEAVWRYMSTSVLKTQLEAALCMKVSRSRRAEPLRKHGAGPRKLSGSPPEGPHASPADIASSRHRRKQQTEGTTMCSQDPYEHALTLHRVTVESWCRLLGHLGSLWRERVLKADSGYRSPLGLLGGGQGDFR